MQTSSISTATFASTIPRSTLVNTSRQVSTLVSPSTIRDTQYSFGRLNTIRQVTEPSSSKVTSAYYNNTLISTLNKPVKTSMIASNINNQQRGPIFLKQLNNQHLNSIVEDAHQKYDQDSQYQYQSFWDKIQRFFDSCNCLKRNNNISQLNSSW